MKDQIAKQISLIKGFAEAAEELMKQDALPVDMKSSMLDGYARDIANCASNLKDMAYTYKLDKVS